MSVLILNLNNRNFTHPMSKPALDLAMFEISDIRVNNLLQSDRPKGIPPGQIATSLNLKNR